MRVAKRRCFIDIEKPVKEKQPNASVVTTWELLVQLWASIETLKGNERQVANASWPESDIKISFRYIEGLLPTMRIVYGNKSYSILNINDVEERHRDLVLICKTGVSAA